MTVEEWNTLTQNVVANAENQGEMTALMTQATDAFSAELAGRLQAEEEVARLTNDNEDLRRYNLELFKRISEQTKNGLPGAAQATAEQDRAETITIEDLFKEE